MPGPRRLRDSASVVRDRVQDVATDLKLTVPIFARSLIYETKTVRGFWLFRWFTESPTDRMAAAIDRTVQLAESGVLRVPEGQPIPVEKFSEAVYLAEATAHGGKPLLVFGP